MALLSIFKEPSCPTAPVVDFSIMLPNFSSLTFEEFVFNCPIPSVAPVVIFSIRLLISLISNSLSPRVAPEVIFSTRATISLGYFSSAFIAPSVAFSIMDCISEVLVPLDLSLPKPLTAPSVTFSIIVVKSPLFPFIFPKPLAAPCVIFSTTLDRLEAGSPSLFNDSEALLVISEIEFCKVFVSIPSTSPSEPTAPIEIDSTAVPISEASSPASSRFCIIDETNVEEAEDTDWTSKPAERRFLRVALLIRVIKDCSGLSPDSEVDVFK